MRKTAEAAPPEGSDRAAVSQTTVLGCSALCGLFLLWVALRSRGFDWFIAETHADIIYSALVYYKEFPYFSFLFNGGTYFVQDPQGPQLSIAPLWVVLFGPTGGVRFAAFFWGFIGCYCTWRWLRAYLDEGAALIAGVSWTLSLGFLWRIAVGNDMFLWYAVLPAVLMALERVVANPRSAAVAALGLLIGIVLLGPTFHALLYLVIPAALAWFVLRVLSAPGRLSAKAGIAVAVLGATSLGLLIASPKIVAWLTMSMSRTFICCDGTFRHPASAFMALVQYFDAAVAALPYKGTINYAVWESAVALCPTSIGLAILGLVVGWRGRGRPKLLYAYAALLLLLGICMATSQPAWEGIWKLTRGSFRVPTRFLALSSFGCAILAGVGADCLARNFAWFKRVAAPLAIAAAFAFALAWCFLALHAGVLIPASLPLWSYPDGTAARAPVTETTLIQQEPRAIGKGKALADGFFVTGNWWVPDYQLQSSPGKAAGSSSTRIFQCASNAAQISLSHTMVEFRDVQPGASIRMCLRYPARGGQLFSEPPQAAVDLSFDQFSMTLTNKGPAIAPLVRLVARSPVPLYAWVTSMITLLGCGAVAARRYWATWGRLLKRGCAMAAQLFVWPPPEEAPPEPPTAHFWLPVIGLVWLGILAGALVVYFNPYRIFVNADDGWPVLESVYHSVRRDGVLMWGADKLGGLHVIIARFMLDGVGLCRWVPHCVYLAAQQAVLLLVGLVWLNRSTRTFLIAGPLFVLCMIQPGGNTTASFNYWLCRVGIVYPMTMFCALLTFGMLLKLARGQGKLGWVLPALGASAVGAFVSSPGNSVLVGVWYLLFCAQQLPQGKKAWRRWACCGATLLLAYWLATWCRGMYDHRVHAHRAITPMAFEWGVWLPTMQRFARDTITSGALSVGVMALGLLIAGAGTCVALLRRIRCTARVCQRLQLTPHGAATMLSVAGVVYLVLLAGNKWVHINLANPTYVLPAYALFIAAAAWLVAALVRRLSPAVVITVAVALLIAAGGQAWCLRPRTASGEYQETQQLLRTATAQSAPLALLGDFWLTCVNSYFDPHRIVSSPGDGGLIADAMLPIVLAHPSVLVNFTRMPQLLNPDGSLPQAFVQRDTVLVREPGREALQQQGWHPYRTIPFDRLVIGSNILQNVEGELHNQAVLTNGLLLMDYPAGALYPEAIWRLGLLPRGLYLLSLTARYRGEPPPSDLCVLHLFDQTLTSPYPSLVIRPVDAQFAYTEYHCLLYYPGCNVPATLRLYSLARQPYEIATMGLYAIPLEDP